MTREELLRRIENKNKDIEKINKRIAKWSAGLRPEDVAICEPFGNCVYGTVPRGMSWSNYHGTEAFQLAKNNYRAYLEKEKGNIPSGDDWNKGPNIDELHTAYIELGEARNTLANYQIQLEKLNNFENSEKIEVLWNFLCEWETKCYNWYLENAKHYLELKIAFPKAKSEWDENYRKSDPEPDTNDTHNHYTWKRYYDLCLRNFKQDYFSDINSLTVEVTTLSGHYENDYSINSEYIYDSYKVDTEKLTKILKEEKIRKYEDLVKRVTSVVGNITDASNLSIGRQNGEINGIVVGDRSKAKVETISACGPVQCFHYRCLVHEIK